MILLEINRLRLLFILFSMGLNHAIEAASLPKMSEMRSDMRIGGSCQKICKTDGCYREAQHFLDTMDTTIDPCDDFYNFACGKFRHIPLKEERSDVFRDLFNDSMKDVTDLLQEEIRPNDLDAVKKIKSYYRNCIDEYERSRDKVLDFLTKTGGFPLLLGNTWNENEYDWREHIYRVYENNILLKFPMFVGARFDPQNSKNLIINIGVGLDFIPEILNKEEFESHCNKLISVAELLGADKNKIREEITELANFQLELFKVKYEKYEEDKEGKRTTLKALSAKHPGVPWLEIVNQFYKATDLVFTDADTIIIDYPETVAKTYEYINKAPKRAIANQIAWIILDKINELLPLNELNSSNNSNTKKRIIKCVGGSLDALPYAMSSMYVKKHFDDDSRMKVRQIYENIKKQMKKNLQQADWLDEETRKNALGKLEAIRVFVGHANEILNDTLINEYYSKLVVKPGSYIESYFNKTSFAFYKDVYLYKVEMKDKYHWTELLIPYVVNAMYFPDTNRIVLAVAYLKRLIFQRDRPNYLNYGALGVTIGHEITHAFDSLGRLYDKNGDINNWWDEETKEKFLERTQCMKDQYSQLTEAEYYYRINGTLTLNENTADNGGFKLSYQAYNNWIKSNNLSEPCLPDLNFTQRQMFWLSAARAWCSKGNEEYVKFVIEKEPHAPFSARVIGSFRNSKEFAEDFKCVTGTRMNPQKKCIIW